MYSYCFNNLTMFIDSSGHFPVAVDKILSGVEHSLGFYKFLLDHSIKGLKPEFIPLDIAKKIARKGGHRQSARAVQRTIYNSTDDLIKNTTRTSRNVNNFLTKFGKTVFILDSAWTIGENIYNGNEHWFTDSAYDISWNALVYGASLLPGGFFWSLMVVGVKSLIEYNYGYEIECFLDDVGDAWNEFWSFDWI